jgi:cytochrome P450
METCTSLCGQLQHRNLVVSEIDGDDFVAQALQFLAAGFETSGSTMSFALYELALHPEIQESLRAEIMQVLNKHKGQLTYDGIQEMAYLDMVVSGVLIEAGRIVIRTFNGKLCLSICLFFNRKVSDLNPKFLSL